MVALLALSGNVRRAAPAIHEELERALAEVVLERDGIVVARGSGVVVAVREEDGEQACYLLTAGHVVAAAASSHLVAVLPGEQGRPGEVIVEVDAEDRDLAVVRTFAPVCRPASIGAAVERGADVWLASFPAQGSPRVWPGHVPTTAPAGEPAWTIDGAVTEGASGGGVFDAGPAIWSA